MLYIKLKDLAACLDKVKLKSNSFIFNFIVEDFNRIRHSWALDHFLKNRLQHFR